MTSGIFHYDSLFLIFFFFVCLHFFKYASVILQVVVLPVALTTCSISVYAIIKAIKRRRKKSKRARIDKKYALRRNFELNKKVARKVRRMEP